MEPRVMPPRSSGMTTMGRALRLRCPVCGQGQLFRRFTMLVHCAHCGFHFEREVGYFTNTAVINYAVASLPILFIVAPLAYLRPHAIALEIAGRRYVRVDNRRGAPWINRLEHVLA